MYESKIQDLFERKKSVTWKWLIFVFRKFSVFKNFLYLNFRRLIDQTWTNMERVKIYIYCYSRKVPEPDSDKGTTDRLNSKCPLFIGEKRAVQIEIGRSGRKWTVWWKRDRSFLISFPWIDSSKDRKQKIDGLFENGLSYVELWASTFIRFWLAVVN